MRATKKDLEQAATVINGILERKGHNERVLVQYAYGQPRAYLSPVGVTWVRDLSPRLPTGELLRWLYAFCAGLELGVGLGDND